MQDILCIYINTCKPDDVDGNSDGEVVENTIVDSNVGGETVNEMEGVPVTESLTLTDDGSMQIKYIHDYVQV